MRRPPPLTLSQILAELPRPPYYHSNGDGSPRCLTISGRMALNTLRGAGVAPEKIVAVLGLPVAVAALDQFSARPSLSAVEVAEERAAKRAKMIANGKSWADAQQV